MRASQAAFLIFISMLYVCSIFKLTLSIDEHIVFLCLLRALSLTHTHIFLYFPVYNILCLPLIFLSFTIFLWIFAVPNVLCSFEPPHSRVNGIRWVLESISFWKMESYIKSNLGWIAFISFVSNLQYNWAIAPNFRVNCIFNPSIFEIRKSVWHFLKSHFVFQNAVVHRNSANFSSKM